jgi:hypothetical protein
MSAPTPGYGYWTEAFERLHLAATTGASLVEVELLAAAELEQLLDDEEAGQ